MKNKSPFLNLEQTALAPNNLHDSTKTTSFFSSATPSQKRDVDPRANLTPRNPTSVLETVTSASFGHGSKQPILNSPSTSSTAASLVTSVRDLATRWQQDVLDRCPQVLSIMVGISDVWHQFNLPPSTNPPVLPDQYHTTLKNLVKQAQPLTRPSCLPPSSSSNPTATTPCAPAGTNTAPSSANFLPNLGTIFVDTQAAFDAVS
ncbi:MAG: hypothetical protein N2035_08895 [Chthoniobacterales bacterium]|nr:hypothetical protein [Chthoniobacterales bacterium]